MNLADVIRRNAAFAPGKVALRFEGGTISYGALSGRIEATAALLAGEFGIGKGDRVAILAYNHPDTLVLLYACARLGAMLVPLNWRLAGPELAYILADADPALFVADEHFAKEAAELAAGRSNLPLFSVGEAAGSLGELIASGGEGSSRCEGRLSDPLLVVYTSGTTGRPKGALLRQEALVWNGVMSQHMHGLTSDDHVLTVLPFFHVGGLNIQTTPALHQGATVTIHSRFAPDTTLAAIADDRPTLTVLVPATLGAVLSHPGFGSADLSSLRAITTGSTYVPQALIDPFERRGVPVLQVYGATETCPISVYTRLGGPRPEGSTGWPGPFCEAKLVDDAGRELPDGTSGEIWIRGPQILSGYWRDEAATRDSIVDGWFRTGDIASRDAAGAYYVHDRKKNVVISGGENIYPAEIERVLLEHEAVAECAVIGRPDPRWGEVPVAHVVLRAGASCTAESLSAHVLSQLARFKAPKDFIFADSLPKSALGKVQHHLLRERR
ncbi:AMP-binding protein [Enterovirga aerilata]|uniref:3-methylmercaptopropionyl-CoA ligase n=1 Tax=Enterovirga aerilata TaxID=2730920 RepID=A0A849IHM8_9HYPH|nr:AMP-binding protein [Enterovirga sp. DB1703]